MRGREGERMRLVRGSVIMVETANWLAVSANGHYRLVALQKIEWNPYLTYNYCIIQLTQPGGTATNQRRRKEINYRNCSN